MLIQTQKILIMQNLYLISKKAFYVALFNLLLVVAGVTKTMAQPQGAINGLFTINSNGDQVYFSQGNLQYQASTNTWKFAEHQYDYVGAANSNISSTYDGWIDLFCWGTSGWNNGNTYYHPWDTDYSDGALYGPVGQYDLTGSYANADWGVYNAISNGGNMPGLWRTLTQPEWEYVFNTRSTPSGVRYAKVAVNDVNGVLLLPDNWDASLYTLNSANTPNVAFSTNEITASDWTLLESQGAVFLPAAGSRKGTSVYTVNTYGYYWSASYIGNNSAYYVCFYPSSLNTSAYYYRFYCPSVRLVRSTQNVTSWSIEAVPNPVEGGTVTGNGLYWTGEECALTAEPADGYVFVNWTENGEEVSTANPYTFPVNGNRNLVANFYKTAIITLTPGWNWISYLLLDTIPIEEALVHLTPNDGDIIKGQEGVSYYQASTHEWVGSLRSLIPGRGYMYYNNNNTNNSFYYPILD